MAETFIKGDVQVMFSLFSTPNYVKTVETDAVNMPSLALPLKAIPDDTFHQLIEQWVREMYEKAEKRRPATPA